MERVNIVAVYIEKDSKVLMVQEKGRAWGLWSLPMGHVDEGEPLEEAAKRETFEETGYTIKVTERLGNKLVSDKDYKGGEKDIGKMMEVSFFRGRIISGDLRPDLEEQLDTKWIEKDKILSLPLRGDWLKDIIS